MRTFTQEALGGLILGTGKSVQGPLSAARTSAGSYYLYPPAGRKILGITATLSGYSGFAWGFIAIDQNTGNRVRVSIVNPAVSANVDIAFEYSVVLSA